MTPPLFIYIGADAAPPPAGPPQIIGYPTVTYAGATQQVGSLASVTDGTWTGSPTSFTYFWRQFGPLFPTGSLTNTFLTNTADLQFIGAVREIFCEVTATNAFGSTTVVSNNIPISLSGRPIFRAAGRIMDLSGNYTQADVLTYTDDELFLDADSILLRQLPVGTNITGLTAPITSGMEFGNVGGVGGRLIVNNINGNRAGGSTGFNTPFSSPLPKVTTPPTLSFTTLNVGDVISIASDGLYTGAAPFFWRGWLRNLSNVVSAGVGNTTYIIQPEDRGHYISLEVLPFTDSNLGAVNPVRSNPTLIPL